MSEGTTSDKVRQALLPTTGRFLAEDFAGFMGYEAEGFRRKLKEEKIRVINWGGTIVVDAEWFWQDLIGCKSETAAGSESQATASEETVKVRSSRKRRGDTESQ